MTTIICMLFMWAMAACGGPICPEGHRIGTTGRRRRKTRLGSLKLKKSQKFSYLFDFGDSWWFEIKVLKLLEERVEQPEIIRSEKEAPKQYPDWEE